MRILLVSDVPLVHELGGGRVQLETAEELRRLGHQVTLMDPTMAPNHRSRYSRLARLRVDAFPRQVARYIREHADRFDVIDALQHCVPFSKSRLGFNGLLLARSTGLTPHYVAYARFEHKRWPERIPGTRVGQVQHRSYLRRISALSASSYREADIIRVLNEDERGELTRLGFGPKAVVLREGLPDRHVEALARVSQPPRSRLAAPVVVTVGSWCLRKGAADWPAIASAVRADVPAVTFRFLGAGQPAESVCRELGFSDGIEVVPTFSNDELPLLIGDATAGALATYAEGYGLGLVEQLAAGIPSVAYDAPGPRAILHDFPKQLVPIGDAKAIAARIVELLRSCADEYDVLSRASLELARAHRLSLVTRELVEIYERSV